MARYWGLLVIGLMVGCQGNGMFRRSETARGQSFSLFGSKAARLDITPGTASKPTNKDVLLIASVYDRDGGTLSRRTVEWTIEGPGEFVAVDGGGWFTKSGKKTGGKFASTATHTFETKLEKKTHSSSTDDPVIRHGQTWVVVSSAVEGRTVVTAVCPDVADREKGRVVAQLVWADSEFTFPARAVAPAGSETKLATDLARLPAPLGYRVRYQILGGAAASLTTGGAGVTSLTGGNTQDLTTNASADGAAEVRIVQAVPAMGTTRVGVEVIKPDPKGVGAGTVVAKGETAVEWATANLSLDFKGPATIGEGREATYTIAVGNGGKAESQPVTLRMSLPPSVALVSSEPPASVQQGREQVWVLPAVPPGERKEMRLTLRATRRGPFDITAVAQTPDGARAEQKLSATADTASVKVSIDATGSIPVNESATVPVRVTNTGLVPIDRGTLWITAGEGMSVARRGSEPADLTVGLIEPGKTAIFDVPVLASRSGSYPIKATLTADGGLTDRSEASVEARTVGMKVTLSGPDRVGLGESASYAVDVVNTGELALADVVVKAELPRGLIATRAEGASISEAGSFAIWKLPSLANGETKRLTLVARGDRIGPAGPLVVNASVGKGMETRVDRQIQVAGLPALEVELAVPGGSVAVGKRVTYRVVLRNRGTGTARDVLLAVELPGEISGVGGRSNLGGEANVSEAKVSFPVIPVLSPGQSVTVYVDGEAVRGGSARVRAVATSPDVPQAVREEQATRVSGSR